MRPLSAIADDDPITLAEASEVVLKGACSEQTLRAAARRGTLQTEHVAGGGIPGDDGRDAGTGLWSPQPDLSEAGSGCCQQEESVSMENRSIRLTLPELEMLRHALRIAAEDGSLFTEDEGAGAKRQDALYDRLRGKINAALSDAVTKRRA